MHWSLTLVLASHSPFPRRLYCCSFFFTTIISTYRSPPAFAHLARVSAHRDAAATRRLIHCQCCYDFVSLSYPPHPPPPNSPACYCTDCCPPPPTPPHPLHFVTLYKVKRSMKTLLICKWVSVKDRDASLSETPRCARVVKVRLIWTLNKRGSVCARGVCSVVLVFAAVAVWQQEQGIVLEQTFVYRKRKIRFQKQHSEYGRRLFTEQSSVSHANNNTRTHLYSGENTIHTEKMLLQGVTLYRNLICIFIEFIIVMDNLKRLTQRKVEQTIIQWRVIGREQLMENSVVQWLVGYRHD